MKPTTTTITKVLYITNLRQFYFDVEDNSPICKHSVCEEFVLYMLGTAPARIKIKLSNTKFKGARKFKVDFERYQAIFTKHFKEKVFTLMHTTQTDILRELNLTNDIIYIRVTEVA